MTAADGIAVLTAVVTAGVGTLVSGGGAWAVKHVLGPDGPLWRFVRAFERLADAAPAVQRLADRFAPEDVETTDPDVYPAPPPEEPETPRIRPLRVQR